MITINMNFSTALEAAQALERLYNLKPGSVSSPKPEVAQARAAEAISHAQETAKAEAPKAPKPGKAEKPAATPTVSETAIAAPQAPAPAEPASASPSEIDYATVSKAITDKVKEDRDAAVAALAKFGVKRGTELKPEQYAEFLKEIA